VVRETNTDVRSPLQGARRVEGPAKDPLGGGEKGNREVEEPLEGPGRTGGRDMKRRGPRHPLLHGCWEAGPGPG